MPNINNTDAARKRHGGPAKKPTRCKRCEKLHPGAREARKCGCPKQR